MNKDETKIIKKTIMSLLEVRFDLIYPKLKKQTYEEYCKPFLDDNIKPYFDNEQEYLDYQYSEMYENKKNAKNSFMSSILHNTKDNKKINSIDDEENYHEELERFENPKFTLNDNDIVNIDKATDDFLSNYIYQLSDDKKELLNNYDKQLIQLNSLLEDSEKIQIVVTLAEQQEKIQAKKYITTKEFAEIFNISVSSQKDCRARLHDSLPYFQKEVGHKIQYVVEDVEKWVANWRKSKKMKGKKSYLQ